MSISTSLDFELYQSYTAKWNEFLLASGLSSSQLENSRRLFTNESLSNHQPETCKLEVYALVGGVPFPDPLLAYILAIQSQIKNILKHTLHYLVEPHNLGLEFCVFKWPNDIISMHEVNTIAIALSKCVFPSFFLRSGGIQVHTDGCIILRGFENGALSSIRSHLSRLPITYPFKQSQWAHIPLGRILEHITDNQYQQIVELCSNTQLDPGIQLTIDHAHFVHEKQWYMVQHSKILKLDLK